MARSARFQLAADKMAVREARLRMREFDELPSRTAADAELVISELVANSLLHAHLSPGDRIDVLLVRDADRLVIEVDDHGGFSGRPRGRRGGMGLRVLDALCEEWRAQGGSVRAALRIGAAPVAAAEERAPDARGPAGLVTRLRRGGRSALA